MFFLDSDGFITTKKQPRAFKDLQMIDRDNNSFELFTDVELVAEAKRGYNFASVLIYDIECYPNYFLVAFKSYETGKVVYFEQSPDANLDRRKLEWVLTNFCIVGFNIITYDNIVAWYAVKGASTLQLYEVTCKIIKEDCRASELQKQYRFRIMPTNHIDLIEVAPLQGSLKTYGGRLHAPRLQDLPFKPGTHLTQIQAEFVRYYCINDLDLTKLLYTDLLPQIKLREQLGYEYKQDLRSKSDAQIAEAVISNEVKELNGYYAKRPNIEPGTIVNYNVPAFVQYKGQQLNAMLELIRTANFVIANGGGFVMPEEIGNLKINIGNSVYRMGLGGLHSSEKCVSHKSDDTTVLIDRDVASYYPRTILNLGLYPHQMGKNFLKVYDNIVTRRLIAKANGDKVTADSLKITINGSFGKLGSKYSSLYAPQLMIQVTLTGQLALLMLIEAIENVGIPIVSANTDGIVIKCPRDRENDLLAVVQAWEQVTGYDTEETRYKAVYSQDVNNYIAVMEKGKCKTKGAFRIADPGKFDLSKNPTNTICVDAVIKLITEDVPIETTITECKDITKFVTVRNVAGGAYKDEVYLGKVVRWYYAYGIKGEINYVTNGHKVGKSEGAKPCLDLPPDFPPDINYKRYFDETNAILEKLAYYAPKTLSFF